MSALLLMLSRRFGAVFGTIVLGAFNDNYFKNALIILFTYRLSKEMGIDTPTLISMAAALFILPFFLCSGLAGELADAMPKHVLVRRLKVIEAVLMLFAALALLFGHPWALLVLLFLIGTQAAFFGPTKYAVLPQLLKSEELLLGNALVEGGTFLSILLGTLMGGMLILRPHGTEIVAATLVLIGLIGVWAAWRVPETTVANPGMKVSYNLLRSTWGMVRHALDNPHLVVPILGISWFWAIGATYLTQLPVFTKDVIGGNEMVVTLFNGVFTVGVALGSFLCPYVVSRFHARDLSPLALTGVLLFGLHLCWMGYHVNALKPDALLGMMAFLKASSDHVLITLDLFFVAFCGGLFIVPLYTQLQTQSSENERARTIASNNVVNALFIATASIIASVMFAQKLTVLHVLLLFTLLNVPVIAVVRRMAGR